MKKYIQYSIFFSSILLLFSSCLNDYLDVSPESGLTEEEVFSKYENALSFFDYVYADNEEAAISNAFKLHWSFSTQKFSLEALTDVVDPGRLQQGQNYKSGSIYPSTLIIDWSYSNGNIKEKYGMFNSMWRATRIANITLEKIHMLSNATDQDKWDLKAQAFFVRGFCLFEAFRGWGPMPHITKPLGPDDMWDIPRPTAYASCMAAAADMDSAIYYFEKAGRMRRDAGPGQAGHLNHPDQFRPSGMAAKAIKARIMLYAASPLNNPAGDIKAWQDAAIENWEAIEDALDLQYELLSFTEYKKNFTGARYSNEQLYGWDAGKYKYSDRQLQFLIPSVLAGKSSPNSADCPTQNMVDKYETIWGDPLNTENDRQAAIALGHYFEQDPYILRDPRFDFSVMYNQSDLLGWQNGKAQIYYEVVNGETKYSELLDHSKQGFSETGYYARKRWGGESVKNKVTTQYTDPIIRLAELYLNYAEAANEAYGPNVPAPGASMTALEAVNHIRARVFMPPVHSRFTTDKEIFRERIKNERNVELAFEGHYYYDIRRWKDAPAIYSGLIYGMNVEKVTPTAEFPSGFKYTRKVLPQNRQMTWRDAMYYFPFSPNDYYKMNNFIPGDKW